MDGMHIYSPFEARSGQPGARRCAQRGVRFTIDACPEAVTPTARAVRALAAVFSFDEERLGQIEQTLGEAMESAVHSAVRGAGDLRIDVGIALDVGMLLVRVTDRGAPLPEGTLAPGWRPSFEPEVMDLLPKAGLGLALLPVLADYVDYQTVAGHNRLTLGYRLPATDRPLPKRAPKVRVQDQAV